MLGVILIGLILFTLSVLRLFSNLVARKRGWKVRINNNNKIAYSEWVNSDWREISFGYRRYSKSAPRHEVFLPQAWETFPEWAQNERSIILDRLRNSLKEPEYTFREV